MTMLTAGIPLHFNGHFPGRPGFPGTRMSPFWIILEPMVIITGAISSSQNVTTNKPTTSFITAWMPFCHATNSIKKLKVKGMGTENFFCDDWNGGKILATGWGLGNIHGNGVGWKKNS